MEQQEQEQDRQEQDRPSEQHAARRAALVARIRAANAETLERLAEL
ncbi:hypothetical protein ABZ747_37450 [Kitasatospora cineracea]